MQNVTNIKSISYLKSRAAQTSEDLEINSNPFFITPTSPFESIAATTPPLSKLEFRSNWGNATQISQRTYVQA
jgi:hypothetical protein